MACEGPAIARCCQMCLEIYRRVIGGDSRNTQLPVAGLGLRYVLRLWGLPERFFSFYMQKKRHFTGHHRLELLIPPMNTHRYHP
jgi:hypothetical protein